MLKDGPGTAEGHPGGRICSLSTAFSCLPPNFFLFWFYLLFFFAAGKIFLMLTTKNTGEQQPAENI